MSGVRTIRATADGALPGISVIAIHGHLHADATPARCGPVYVDEENRLLRIIEVRPTRTGFDVPIETADPPFPRTGELPGYATRVGPWPGRLHDHVLVIGPGEISRANGLRPRGALKEPPNVERFMRWLGSEAPADDALQCQRVEDAAAWYCSRSESFALIKRIHGLARKTLFDAVRAGDADALEDAAWWLSRAAIADADIWLAGAALRQVASLDWEIMIREGLKLRGKQDIKLGLEQAQWHLDHPPPAPARERRGAATVRYGRAALATSLPLRERTSRRSPPTHRVPMPITPWCNNPIARIDTPRDPRGCELPA